MYKNLFNGIDIKDENVHVPCGQGNIQENCDEYNKMLAENPIDIQLLGIGSNGHMDSMNQELILIQKHIMLI